MVLDPPVDTANHTIASDATVTITAVGLGTDTFAGKSGTLVLDLASDFAGKISGFGGQDRLDLADIGFGTQTTLGYSANATGGGGTLTVSDTTHIAKIALLGSYMGIKLCRGQLWTRRYIPGSRYVHPRSECSGIAACLSANIVSRRANRQSDMKTCASNDASGGSERAISDHASHFLDKTTMEKHGQTKR